RILRNAFAAHDGREVDTQGDAFFVAFSRARDAVLAAVAAQRGLAEHRWPEGGEILVRMGIHTGEATVTENRYVGLSAVRAARIRGRPRGRKILISKTTRHILDDEGEPLPGAELVALGESPLKDLDQPVRLSEIVIGDWPQRPETAPAEQVPESPSG